MQTFLRSISVAVLFCMSSPAAADSVIASYHAYIGVDDLYNSKGERLSAPWQVLRQDRANFHRFGISQQADEWDPVFHDVNAREALERLRQRGSLSRAAQADIMRGDSNVYVTIWGQGRNATYVDVVTWAECGC